MDQKTLKQFKEIIKEATRDLASKKDLNRFVTKDDLKNLATKDDLTGLEKRFEHILDARITKSTEEISELIKDLIENIDEKRARKADLDVLQARLERIEKDLHIQ